MNPILIKNIRKTFKEKLGKVSVLVNSPGRINLKNKFVSLIILFFLIICIPLF